MLFAQIDNKSIRAERDALIGTKAVPKCIFCGQRVYLDESKEYKTFTWRHLEDSEACQRENERAQAQLDAILGIAVQD